MPSYHKRDPRSYVKSVPVPVPFKSDAKILARCSTVYNPEEPSRQQVYREHYKRRQQQWNNQGFRALNYKPYQGIGDPFYLEPKQIILHALGQWDGSQGVGDSDDSDTDKDNDGQQDDNKPKQTAKGKFVLRRKRKDLNTLPKEVASGRELIKNVSLGHGLFHLLRKQSKEKTDLEQKEKRKQLENARNEWQPPKYDSSSSDETDNELSEDVELNLYLTSAPSIGVESCGEEVGKENLPHDGAGDSQGDTLTQGDATTIGENTADNRSRVAFQGLDGSSTTGDHRSARSRPHSQYSSRPSSRKSKHSHARPYTPNHSNITSADAFNSSDRQALFRQICCLYWILEAMNAESPSQMSPINLSWNLKDIGGSKVKDRKQEKEKLDSKWKSFISNQQLKPMPNYMRPRQTSIVQTNDGSSPMKSSGLRKSNDKSGLTAKRNSSFAGSRLKTSRRISTTPHATHVNSARGSISTLTSPYGSQTQLSGPATPAPNIRVDNAIPEEKDSARDSCSVADDADDLKNTGLFRFLDEYYDSMRKEEFGDDKNDDKNSVLEVSSSKSDRSDLSPGARRKRLGRKSPEGDYGYTPRERSESVSTAVPAYRTLSESQAKQILEKIYREEESDIALHKSTYTEKRNSQNFRADINVRASSQPSKYFLDFKASLPSTRIGTLAGDMKQRFTEVRDEKSLILHDSLEALERDRLRKMRRKFANMPTGGSSFHRALVDMRQRSSLEAELNREKLKEDCLHQSWYMDLLSVSGNEEDREWYFKRIMDKLSKYGLVEASKQSAYRFLNVLSALRPWEICNPDVSAAIEFCRERIVEMSVEEFEDWFRTTFPMVSRPQTAPPTLKEDKSKTRDGASSVKSATPMPIPKTRIVPSSAPAGRSGKL